MAASQVRGNKNLDVPYPQHLFYLKEVLRLPYLLFQIKDPRTLRKNKALKAMCETGAGVTGFLVKNPGLKCIWSV